MNSKNHRIARTAAEMGSLLAGIATIIVSIIGAFIAIPGVVLLAFTGAGCIVGGCLGALREHAAIHDESVQVLTDAEQEQRLTNHHQSLITRLEEQQSAAYEAQQRDFRELKNDLNFIKDSIKTRARVLAQAQISPGSETYSSLTRRLSDSPKLSPVVQIECVEISPSTPGKRMLHPSLFAHNRLIDANAHPRVSANDEVINDDLLLDIEAKLHNKLT